MSAKWKSPYEEEWDENNQDANIAFTLVARNEAAKQMWADPHNSSRYVPASFKRKRARNWSQDQVISKQPDSEPDGNRLQHKNKKDTEPALRFLFSDWPKKFGKGYVLGSCEMLCDALLGDPEDFISEETLAFTFNKDHELIMNVTSESQVWVKFRGQKGAYRHQFTWIFPRGQEPIRVNVADLIEFDVVLPKYGIYKDNFHQNCQSFLSSVNEDLPADNVDFDSTTVVRQPSGLSPPKKSFYLRGKILGSGSYGDVHEVLCMPDSKIYAAKKFKYADSFRQEADMLKKACKTYHKNIVQFIEEWHEDHDPLLIMEYVAGGSLVARSSNDMECGEIAKLANQTLSALVFLHDQGILHRDLKPANILCMTPGHYKIADFRVSKEVATLLNKQGTTEYIAPKVHDRTSYSYPADIWSLGVVLLECLDSLPDGVPGVNGRRWCKKVLSKCKEYNQSCKDMEATDALQLTEFIGTAMLHMDPNKRLSARECLEDYQDLLVCLSDSEDSKAVSGANTPTQTHPNGSFPPNPHNESEGDEAGAETSSTARWNSGGTLEAGREPIHYRNEDGTTVANHGKAGESLLSSISFSPPSVGEGELYEPSSIPFSPSSVGEGELYELGSIPFSPPAVGEGEYYPSSVLPWLPSIGEENLYDPANVIPWPASIGGGTLYNPGRTFSSVPSSSQTETRARSISDTSMRSRHGSDALVEGTGEDGSVTPGRRAPYHPGNEVAAPGRGFFPPSPWVSSRNQVRSGKSEPSRRQRKIAARRSARRP